MSLIVITIQRDRTLAGTLRVESSSGKTQLGPWPVAFCPYTDGEACVQDNISFEQERLLGEFLVTSIVPIGAGSTDDVHRFGRYGIFKLSPSRTGDGCDVRTGWLRELFLYGGMLLQGKLAIDSPGSFRLRPEHHRTLLMAMGDQPLPIRCICLEVDELTPSQALATQDAASSEVNVVSRVAVLAAAAAIAASPFFLPTPARGQGACSVPYEIGALFTAVDFIQLAEREGGTRESGFVPDDSSGVNIAAGFDLGKTTRQELTDMGFTSLTIEILSPYLAISTTEPVIGSKASRILAAAPLNISREQAEAINHIVFSWHANAIGGRFNLEVAKRGRLNEVTFSRLPSEFQTAMTQMFLLDRNFVDSKAFSLFVEGRWSEGLVAMREYSSPKLAIRAQAKLAATQLSRSVSSSNLPDSRI